MSLDREGGAVARLGKFCVRFVMAAVLGAAALPAWSGCYQSRCAAPGATISAPAPNASFQASQSITMTGRAFGDWIADNASGDQIDSPISRVDVYKDGV